MRSAFLLNLLEDAGHRIRAESLARVRDERHTRALRTWRHVEHHLIGHARRSGERGKLPSGHERNVRIDARWIDSSLYQSAGPEPNEFRNDGRDFSIHIGRRKADSHVFRARDREPIGDDLPHFGVGVIESDRAKDEPELRRRSAPGSAAGAVREA